MSGSNKPRVTVRAGGTEMTDLTTDNFQNFRANLGMGTNNLMSGGSYGFNPISRQRTLLEWMYRGSWLVQKVVDCPADDMTREGINIESDAMKPDDVDELTQYWTNLQLWQRINDTLKWARLYGGAIAVMMVDGQDPATELRIDTIRKEQFKGLLVLDRWQVWPHVESLVKDYGVDWGLPEFYEVVADARAVPRMRIHHSRCIRFDGLTLPYWQKQAENEWGLSVIEPMWDRMVAFDSVSAGAAQLVYKAHLRVVKFPGFREIVALGGGPMYQGLLKTIQFIRSTQTNEGLTVLDGDDAFEANSYTFAGLSDMMIQFAQQVSGAADVPMTRMFGQSPAGMNATGESDMRNYYDGIKSKQEVRLRRAIKLLLDITHRSLWGKPLPDGFNFTFKPLWQMTEEAKSGVASQTVQSVVALAGSGIYTPPMALREISQSSRVTGFGAHITDKDIAEAEMAPPAPPQSGGQTTEPGSQEQGRQTPGSEGNVPAEPVPDTPPDAPSPSRALRLLSGGASGGPVKAEDEVQSDPNILTSAVIKLDRGITARANLPAGVRVNFRDAGRPSMIDVSGIQCVIETAKGESRLGYGWASVMPAHYGYINGTSSAEGPTEQMDCYVGDDLLADKAWVIDQRDPYNKRFDEHKVMLGFPDRELALDTYRNSFNDGLGEMRIGDVREMDVSTLKEWLEQNPYGSSKAMAARRR